MDVWTFWSVDTAFYILSNFIMNHHGHKDVLEFIIELLRFLQGTLTTKEIIPENFKSIKQFNMPKLTKRATYVRTDPNFRKALA